MGNSYPPWTAAIMIAVAQLAACSGALPTDTTSEAPAPTATSQPSDDGMTLEEGERLQEALNTTDLGVMITASRESPNAGDTLVYIAILRNHGPNPASLPTLTWMLDPELEPLEDDAGCVIRHVQLDCHLSELESMDTVEVRLTVRIRSSAQQSQTLVTTAVVENEAGPDPQPSNNTTRVETTLAAN